MVGVICSMMLSVVFLEEAGSHYTPRGKLLPDGQSTLIEADEELFVDKKELKILDMAAGDRWCKLLQQSYIRKLDTGATVRLFWSKGFTWDFRDWSSDMLIRQEDSHEDRYIKRSGSIPR